MAETTKCSRCKAYWTPDSEADRKSSGALYRTCQKCRQRKRDEDVRFRCPHGKRKCRCLECGGTSMCEHAIRKRICKQCSTAQWLVHLQEKAISVMLKKSELDRWKTTIDFLGCGPQELKEYIESKMKPGMTWENINLDHYKPKAAFDLDDPAEFLRCVHYTNLQPLIARDNFVKGSAWSDEDEKYWRENVIDKSLL